MTRKSVLTASVEDVFEHTVGELLNGGVELYETLGSMLGELASICGGLGEDSTVSLKIGVEASMKPLGGED